MGRHLKKNSTDKFNFFLYALLTNRYANRRGEDFKKKKSAWKTAHIRTHIRHTRTAVIN